MARKKYRERVQRTVYFRRDNDAWVENLAKKEYRSFAQMVEVLVHRARRQQEEAA